MGLGHVETNKIFRQRSKIDRQVNNKNETFLRRLGKVSIKPVPFWYRCMYT